MRNALMARVFVPPVCRIRHERLKAAVVRSNRIGSARSALALDAPQLPVCGIVGMASPPQAFESREKPQPRAAGSRWGNQ